MLGMRVIYPSVEDLPDVQGAVPVVNGEEAPDTADKQSEEPVVEEQVFISLR